MLLKIEGKADRTAKVYKFIKYKSLEKITANHKRHRQGNESMRSTYMLSVQSAENKTCEQITIGPAFMSNWLKK